MSFNVEKLDKLENIIHNPAMGIIVGALFVVILLIGLWIGFERGTFSAIYMLGANIIMFVASIFIAPLITKAILTILNKVQVDPEYKEKLTTLAPFINGLLMLAIVIVGIIISESIYIVIRKLLLRKVEAKKEEGIKVSWLNHTGALIGTVSTFPLALCAASASGIVATNSKVANAVDKTFNALSFKKANGAGEYTDALIGIARLSLDSNLAEELNDFATTITKADNYELDTSDPTKAKFIFHPYKGNPQAHKIDQAEAKKINHILELLTLKEAAYGIIEMGIEHIMDKIQNNKFFTTKDYINTPIEPTIEIAKDPSYLLECKLRSKEILMKMRETAFSRKQIPNEFYKAQINKTWAETDINNENDCNIRRKIIIDHIINAIFKY